ELAASIDALRRAGEAEPATLPSRLLEVGDLQLKAKHWKEADASYQAAAQQDAASSEPVLRRIALYGSPGSTDVPKIQEICSSAEATHPDVLPACHAAVVRCAMASDPKLALSALGKWLEARAATGHLGADSLTELPSWNHPAVRTLADYLADPVAKAKPAFEAWRQIQAESALGRAAIALGRDRLAANHPPDAEAIWRAALDQLPSLQQPSRDSVRLDLCRELLNVYLHHPTLDAGEAKSRRLLDQLFQGKAAAYQTGDREAVFRLHALLAVVYDDRGQWTEGGYRNARFQLEHAIRTARELERTTGAVYPLADLQMRLAKGLASHGSLDAARGRALDAVQGLLDEDRVTEAEEMLSFADTLPVGEGPGGPKRAAALGRLVAVRNSGSCAEVADEPDLPARFVARQKFRAYADCDDAARALALPVLDEVPLVGFSDALRVERLQSRVTEGTPRPLEASSGPRKPGDLSEGSTVAISLPNRIRPTYLSVAPEARVAALASTFPGADASKVRVRVDGQRVTVYAPEGEMEKVHDGFRRSGHEAVRVDPRPANAGPRTDAPKHPVPGGPQQLVPEHDPHKPPGTQPNPFGIDVSVSDGVVTLRGKVASAQVKERAELWARHQPGVKEVQNLLTVDPH
ncbi:MAG TPA: BON domain-containing protein, partial [Candidatus Polarisedimenticolaceae bacterium]|nr:BON domain-containing protein [Candidatus Polarisedimenticolaceae bacterium]